MNNWTANATTVNRLATNLTSGCNSLFMAFTRMLYCSMEQEHQVVSICMDNCSGTLEMMVGNGTNGSASDLLSYPNGIFVDIELNLYVADSGNNRIQLFRPNETNGTTVAGNQTLEYLGLNFPTGVILDANNNLYITDRDHHRIIQSVGHRFRCIVGCSRRPSSASSPLNKPQALWFDAGGNIFVLDNDNSRLQKFLVARTSCGMFNQR